MNISSFQNIHFQTMSVISSKNANDITYSSAQIVEILETKTQDIFAASFNEQAKVLRSLDLLTSAIARLPKPNQENLLSRINSLNRTIRNSQAPRIPQESQSMKGPLSKTEQKNVTIHELHFLDLDFQQLIWNATRNNEYRFLRSGLKNITPAERQQYITAINPEYEASPLLLAALCGHEESFDLLLNYCEDKTSLINKLKEPQKGGITVLYAAAQGGNSSIVNKILLYFENREERCAHMQQHTDLKFTPLSVAVNNGHVAVIRALLKEMDYEAQFTYLQQEDIDGRTPLFFAASFGRNLSAEALLENLDTLDRIYYLNKGNYRLFTPLMSAVSHGQAFAVEDLLSYFDKMPSEKHAYLIKQMVTGETALHIAVEKSDTKILSILLSATKDDNEALSSFLQLKNYFGLTAMDLALLNGQEECATILKNAALKAGCIIETNTCGKSLTQIDQIHLNKQIKRYLILRGNITEELLLHGTLEQMPVCYEWDKEKKIWDIEGLCAGFSFLHSYYSAMSKVDQFYSALESISNWDGSEQALLKTLDNQTQFKNLEDLINQWINDLFWFQHDHITSSFQLFAEQWDRASRFEVVKQKGERLQQEHCHLEVSRASLHELFELLFSSFQGEVNLATKNGHGVAATFHENGKISYYDSNLKQRMKPVSYQVLADLSLNSWYYGKPYPDKLEIDVTFLKFSGNMFKPHTSLTPPVDLLHGHTIEGWTPLHKAMLLPDIAVVYELLSDPLMAADIFTLDHKKRIPLHLANSREKVEVLLSSLTQIQKYQCLQQKDYQGFTPFHKAIIKGQSDIAAQLLSHFDGEEEKMEIKETQCEPYGSRPLHMIAVQPFFKALEQLNIIFQGTTSLQRMKLLQSSDIFGYTPLHYVASYGKTELLSQFLVGLSSEEIHQCMHVQSKDGHTPTTMKSRVKD